MADIIWANILYNILRNESELKLVYQQNFPLVKKLAVHFFGQSVSIEFQCLYMVSVVSEEELKWQNDIWSFTNEKNEK